MSENSFTETTTTGWFSRIGNSIKGIIVGLIMVVVAFPVLFLNEGRAVKTRKDLDRGAKDFVSTDAAKVDAANDGKLVHFSGQATAEGIRKDDDLNVFAEVIALRRKVEMYQWLEKTSTEKKKKLGGKEETVTTYSYAKEWAEGRVDSSAFKKASEYPNPNLPLSSHSWIAPKVTVGAFTLPQGLVTKIGSATPLSLGEDIKLPKKYADRKLKREGNVLYLAKNPSSPKLGDVRISYEVVRPAAVSVVAKQKGDTLEPHTGKSGTTIYMLQMGEVSGEAMFENAQKSNKVLTWILRLVGFILMYIGFSLVFKPLSVIADVLPIAGTIVGVGTGIVAFLLAMPLSLITISIAWIFYRPLIGIPLLLVAGVGLFFLVKKVIAYKKSTA